MSTVFCVIPVFNRWATTEACIRHLQLQTYGTIEIIVSDGLSTDQTVVSLNRYFPEVHVIVPQKEQWWGGAMHNGIEYAMERAAKDDFILMLNNDTAFDSGYVETLVRVSKEQDAAVGSLIVDQLRPHTVLDAGEYIDWDCYAFPIRTDVPDGMKFREGVDTLPGRGTLIPIKFIRAFGNVNALKFPHYISDYEFSYRLKMQGVRLLVSFEARIYSDVSQTGIQDNGKDKKFRERVKVIFSKRSGSNIFDHLKFIACCAPKERKLYLSLLLIFRSTDRILLMAKRTYFLRKFLSGRILNALRRRMRLMQILFSKKKEGKLPNVSFTLLIQRVFLPAYFLEAGDFAELGLHEHSLRDCGAISKPDAKGRSFMQSRRFLPRAPAQESNMIALAKKKNKRCPVSEEDFIMFLDVVATK